MSETWDEAKLLKGAAKLGRPVSRMPSGLLIANAFSEETMEKLVALGFTGVTAFRAEAGQTGYECRAMPPKATPEEADPTGAIRDA
jgi:hypothetical protein